MLHMSLYIKMIKEEKNLKKEDFWIIESSYLNHFFNLFISNQIINIPVTTNKIPNKRYI